MKTMRGRFRAAVLMGAAASVLVFAAGAKAQDQNSNDNPWPVTAIRRRTIIRGRTTSCSGRPCWRWLATSPASQARRSRAGEKAGENCDRGHRYTSTSLWHPRRPLRIRLRL